MDFPVEALVGNDSDVLKWNHVLSRRLTICLHNLRLVLSKLLHLGVCEDQRDKPLIEPLQVLRVLRPGEVLSPLDKGSDCIALHQLVVSNLWVCNEQMVKREMVAFPRKHSTAGNTGVKWNNLEQGCTY